MKIATYLHASPIIGNDVCSTIYERFKDEMPAGFESHQSFGQFSMPFSPDSEALACACKMIENTNHSSYELIRAVRYTKKEIEQVPFFSVYLPTPLELVGSDTAKYGTIYDDGCPNCGVGKSAIGSVFVDRKCLNKLKMGSLFSDIVVRQEIKEVIECAGLTGISFPDEVKDYKGRAMENHYFKVSIDNILPPLSNQTWLTRYESANCPFHPSLYLRSELQYEQTKLENATDFNLTNEFLNAYRERQLVISARARKILINSGIIRSHFFPVTLL